MSMSIRERFHAVLNFRKPEERLPMVEWAAWWDRTVQRWEGEGLPRGLDLAGSLRHFNLDPMFCLFASPRAATCPAPAVHGGAIIESERDYERVRPHLYSDADIAAMIETAKGQKARHDRGESILRLWLDGFFWFPRRLMGIEPHMYAFYDQPGLMHRVNRDLTAFSLRTLDALGGVLKPDMVGFAEDMSYNNGPMLSRDCFDEFLLPYYRQVVPRIKAAGIKVFVDSDGQVEPMIPWLEAAGIDGVFPLERQSGVDIRRIRTNHPRFLMLGGFDKMTMSRGEDAMRAEFERLLPVMRSGGYVPSVDHQTPPEVSLENYRTYLRLFGEYARKGARTA